MVRCVSKLSHATTISNPLSGPRELRPSYKYHMSQNENLYALTIKDLMFEDEGDYTFKVEGHETQCRLKIDGKPFGNGFCLYEFE